MTHPWSTLGLAVMLFAATNVDDVFLLVALFADPGYRPRQVVMGQLLGMAALIAASAAAALLALVVPPRYVGLLGIVPLALGIVQLFRRGDAEEEEAPGLRRGLGKTLAVALVTVANGGDNLAVYIPFFATRTRAELIVTSAVFLVLTGGLCALAHALVSHPRLGEPLRRHAPWVTPLVLIALGVVILIEAESYRLVIG
jgi:cadmium resistance protein CadD (predicted permease)